MNKPDYKTALIVVDMVRDFAAPEGAVYYPQNGEILPRITDLVSFCRDRNVLIIFMQHYHRKDIYDAELCSGRRPNCIEGTGGEQLMPELGCDESRDIVIKKRRYNSFAGTDLDLVLREHGIERLIVCGTKTNCCIRATVEGGYHLGYDVWIPSDCVATNDETVQKVHLSDIDKYLGHVATSRELRELLDSGNFV